MTASNPVFSPSWRSAFTFALLLAFSTQLLRPPPPLPPPPPSSSSPPAATSLPDILGRELLTRIRHLGLLSEPSFPSSAGVNRPFLSPSGARARAALLTYMTDAGLQPAIDGAGNVVARLVCPISAPTPRKALALGSHFDTVRGGGLWDGPYGILAAIAVAKAVAHRPAGGVCTLPFDLAVFAFDDEEGNNNFGTTNFGAKAIAGLHHLPRDVEPLLDAYKNVFPDVAADGPDLRKAVSDRVRNAAVHSDELIGFIEMHIEQGPVLETLGASVGVVDAIAGQTRLSVTFSGQAGHAGTVPMSGRRDALAAAARAVILVEEVGTRGASDSVVATVGSLTVKPGSSNVIPGSVTMSVDLRAPRDAVREQALADILAGLEAIGQGRDVGVQVTKTHEVAAVAMSPWLRGVLEDVAAAPVSPSGCVKENCSASFEVDKNAKSVVMTSGAGHDTQFMSKVTDVAMMFVRCRGGVSHHPDEHVDEEDAKQGAWALLRAVYAIAESVGKK